MTTDERFKYLRIKHKPYCRAGRKGRSRPSHKNDNRFVEQKNFTLPAPTWATNAWILSHKP